jgi:hypothetical protein
VLRGAREPSTEDGTAVGCGAAAMAARAADGMGDVGGHWSLEVVDICSALDWSGECASRQRDK